MESQWGLSKRLIATITMHDNPDFVGDTLNIRIRYNSNDPFAVSLDFCCDESTWVLDRENLFKASVESTSSGLMDIVMSANIIDVNIGFNGAGNGTHMAISIPRPGVRKFCQDIVDQIPFSKESDYVKFPDNVEEFCAMAKGLMK